MSAKSSTSSWRSPCVGIFVFIKKRLKFFFTFYLAKLLTITLLVKIWSDLCQPLWVNRTNFSHVLLTCLYQFVINYPLRAFIKQTTAWMYEYLLIVSQSLKAFCRVFLCSMKEKTSTNCFSNLVVLFHVVLATWDHR